MPPHSTHLEQEGVVFISFKLVSEGHLNEQELKDILNAPCNVSGCSSARNIVDNLADLNAQIAANHKGIILLRELVSSYSLPVVRSYMSHIQQNAELAVRQLIKNVATKAGERIENKIFKNVAEDKMDDGTPIKLALEINKETVKNVLYCQNYF
jgi:5-oxoprolinase (ATP-hydrolysing)